MILFKYKQFLDYLIGPQFYFEFTPQNICLNCRIPDVIVLHPVETLHMSLLQSQFPWHLYPYDG